MNAKPYIDSLRNLRLSHKNFRHAYRSAYAQSSLAPPGQVIAIVGPTRVGKTTLSHRLARELVKTSTGSDERFVPLIRIEAATTNQGKFSTKHFTLRALAELADPITLSNGVGFRRNQSETHLRLQLERSIEYRQTKFLIIDEAHHLLRTTGLRQAGDVLDTFKCLGNSTGVVIVFIGGYELLTTCFSSAHLNGRLSIVDFPPYTHAAESMGEFDRILLTLDGMLPFSEDNSLIAHRDLIYAGSLGCLGLLVGWCISAMAEMQAREDESLAIKHFEATRSSEQIRPIREEIALGQQLLPSKGFGSLQPREPTNEASKSSNKQRRKPFVRNPKRDPGPILGHLP